MANQEIEKLKYSTDSLNDEHRSHLLLQEKAFQEEVIIIFNVKQ